MKQRPLGPSGLQASVVAFGAWAVGGWRWGGQEEKASIDAIRAGIDAGINVIDTAPVYGFGRSEEIVGKAIAGIRDKVLIATKCGIAWEGDKGDLLFVSDDKGKNEQGQYPLRKHLGLDSVRKELENSLRRLKVDAIDLYQTHWQDLSTPTEDVMSLLLDFKKEGKIRAIGACNAGIDHLDRYRMVGTLDADQERFSMLDRKMEPEQLPYCLNNNVAVLAYSPLHHGLLTGKISADRTFNEGDLRRDLPRFKPDGLKLANAMLNAFKPIADRHGISIVQLVIAWTVAQPGLTHALVGARSAVQAVENARAGDVELSADDLAEMDRIVSTSGVK